MPAFTPVIECNVCGATFNQWAGLYRHKRTTHTNRELHVCDQCGKSFRRRDNLVRHQKTHDTPKGNESQSGHEDKFPCQYCGEVFKHSHDKRRHEKTIHKSTTFVCETCGKEYGRKDNLHRHLKTHSNPTNLTDDDGHQPTSNTPGFSVGADDHPATQMVDNGGQEEFQPKLRTVEDVCAEHRQLIQTHTRVNNRVRHLYNFEFNGHQPDEMRGFADKIFERQKTAYKVNVAFGFILRHGETQELKYYYPSTNNRLFTAPHQIVDRASHETFIQVLLQSDYLEYARQQRPNTKWTVHRITNISFYVYPLRDFPIGCQHTALPEYIKRNRAIIVGKEETATKDNLCLFRCLASHFGAKKKRTERMTLKYYRKFTSESPPSLKASHLKNWMSWKNYSG